MGFKTYTLCVILLQLNFGKCFECPGYSIPRKFRCDAVNNCGDNSDEEGCPTTYTGKPFFHLFYTDLEWEFYSEIEITIQTRLKTLQSQLPG